MRVEKCIVCFLPIWNRLKFFKATRRNWFYNSVLVKGSRTLVGKGAERRSGIEVRVDHLVLGFLVGSIISFALFFYSASVQSAFVMVIFNFLFVSLTFPLDGDLGRKTCLLLSGNGIGWLWNWVFNLLISVIIFAIGDVFYPIYMILNPFANLIWMVSFWSVSLSVLASSREKRLVMRLDS